MRARLELRVRLRGHEVRVVRDLDELDQPVVGRQAAEHEAVLLELRAVPVVELEAVPVALVDDRLAVDLAHRRALQQLGRIGTETHRAALVLDVVLVGHQVDDRVGAARLELRRVGVLETDDVASELDAGGLQPEAQTEVRDLVLARHLRGLDLALDPAVAEPARDDDAVGATEPVHGVVAVEVVRAHPVELDADRVVQAGVAQRLDDRQVGVGQLDVLADQGDADLVRPGLDRAHPADDLAPVGEVEVRALGVGEIEATSHDAVESRVAHRQRHLVDRARVHGRDDGVLVDVRLQRHLLAQALVELTVAAQHEHVGVDADAAQLAHRVLGRLGLQLVGSSDVRDQRAVDVADAVAADVVTHLAHGLEERQPLDVAHGAADFGDDDVDVGRDRQHTVLDLVGDVRDHLDRLAEVVTPTFLVDDRLPDLARADAGAAVQRVVQEPLVVPEVEVRLATVVGDEHLAVLERVHRARVDVDVRIELLQHDLEASGLQQAPEGRSRDALAQRGGDTPGHEDELRLTGARHAHLQVSWWGIRLVPPSPLVGEPLWTAERSVER